jgi:hypothetical protein
MTVGMPVKVEAFASGPGETVVLVQALIRITRASSPARRRADAGLKVSLLKNKLQVYRIKVCQTKVPDPSGTFQKNYLRYGQVQDIPRNAWCTTRPRRTQVNSVVPLPLTFEEMGWGGFDLPHGL